MNKEGFPTYPDCVSNNTVFGNYNWKLTYSKKIDNTIGINPAFLVEIPNVGSNLTCIEKCF